MTEVGLMATRGPALTLGEEHVLLLWQVTASAEKLLAAAEHGRWPGAELASLAGYAQAEVLRQVSDEEALLFPAVPSEGPVIDLDALPPGQAVAAATDRLLRMRRGEQVELQWSTDLNAVWREISELSPSGYRFTVVEDGPARWRMQVTHRQAAGRLN